LNEEGRRAGICVLVAIEIVQFAWVLRFLDIPDEKLFGNVEIESVGDWL
jgi:hypothetical protein